MSKGFRAVDYIPNWPAYVVVLLARGILILDYKYPGYGLGGLALILRGFPAEQPWLLRSNFRVSGASLVVSWRFAESSPAYASTR